VYELAVFRDPGRGSKSAFRLRHRACGIALFEVNEIGVDLLAKVSINDCTEPRLIPEMATLPLRNVKAGFVVLLATTVLAVIPRQMRMRAADRRHPVPPARKLVPLQKTANVRSDLPLYFVSDSAPTHVVSPRALRDEMLAKSRL
jgi:hypothetical protein